MLRLSMRLAIPATLAVAFVVGAAPSADAALTLTLYQASNQAGTQVVVNEIGTTGTAVFAGTIGDFTGVTATAGSNSPGTNGPTGAFLTQTTITLSNTSGSTQTIVAIANDGGFLAPATDPVLATAAISGSDLTGSGQATYVATVDSTVLPTVSIPGIDAATTSANVTVAAPYSMNGVLSITLAAGQTATITGTTRVNAVPEPGTIAMAFMAAPLLGLGYYRHRRRTRS